MEQDRLTKRIKFTQEILSKISKIDEFNGLWQGSLRLSPHILGRLKRSVIITSTGASTRIEGAKMSDEEVARFLRGLKTRPPRNRDEEEVAGYADLAGRIFDTYKTLKLTEGQILQFHKILLQFSKKDQVHLGAYKSSDNIVVARADDGGERVLFRPTPPYLVKKEMDDVLLWTNDMLEKKELHPILVTCNFIFEFLAIHPFIDGNGRLSRALTNLLLLQTGYSYVPYVSLDEIIEDHQAEYYQSLRATQANHKTDHEDITPWVGYMLRVLTEQTEKARAIMESEKPENLLSEKQHIVHNLFGAGNELSVSDIDTMLKGNIPKATIKQALSRLVALKLLERIGQGRGTRYRRV
ncbi:MAG TPA: Fic family protein [Candidatus Paceibacterota bacterium]|nr:Fic family protein [Candidatus Paceibacterota bacterium]